MKHEIPPEIPNSLLEYCVDEYVRNERDREILMDHWFRKLSIYSLADKYKLSDYAIKRLLYGEGDRVLLLAAKLNKTK